MWKDKFRNYEDSKCAWGYMTLCDDCARLLTSDAHLSKLYRHVSLYKCVEGFPTPYCERCGAKNIEYKETK